MPTSNGQVTSRDLRQEVVKTPHVRDDAITEPKLSDDAVTIEKLGPVAGFEVGFAGDGNLSITTTETQHLTVATVVPTWATIALFFIESTIQLTVGGTGFTLFFRTELDDDGNANGASNAHKFDASATRSIFPVDVKKRTVPPGATITTGLWVWTSATTNTSNQLALRVGAMFGKEEA